jgi:hypothetical protein
LSAGGQDEQPWLVKSSTTARGSAAATVANEAEKAAAASAMARNLCPGNIMMRLI